MGDDMYCTRQLQELRRIGDWAFYNNGWWYTKNKRACFYKDVNVQTNYLVVAEWFIREEKFSDIFMIQTNEVISGFDRAREDVMEEAFKKVEGHMKSFYVEV